MTRNSLRPTMFAEVRLIVAGDCATALVPWSGFVWSDNTTPRTDRPVRFQRHPLWLSFSPRNRSMLSSRIA